MTTTTHLLLAASLCLVGLTLGVGSRDITSRRHFFRGHQLPGLVEDPLEEQLFELRNETHSPGPSHAAVPDLVSEERVRSSEQLESRVTSQEVPSSSSSDASGEVSSSQEESPAKTSSLESSQESPSGEDRGPQHPERSVKENESKEPGVTSESSRQQLEDEDESNDSDENDDDDDENDENSPAPPPTSTAVPATLPKRVLPYNMRAFTSDKRDAEQENGMMELMMRLAEHPAQWERVHHELKHLDQELLASRRAVQMLGLARNSGQTSGTPEGDTPASSSHDDVTTDTHTESAPSSPGLHAKSTVGNTGSNVELHVVSEDLPSRSTRYHTKPTVNNVGNNAELSEDLTTNSETGNSDSETGILNSDTSNLDSETETIDTETENSNPEWREIRAEKLVALPDALLLENEADRVEGPTSSPPPHHRHHATVVGKPHFLYHRVTDSPADAHSIPAPHGHHRNAFIAVSAVTTPKPHGKLHFATTPATHELVPRPPLQRVSVTSHKAEVTSRENAAVTSQERIAEESVSSEEREIERLVQSLRASPQSGWNHEQHRQHMKEQLRALEALHAQLEARWRAQELRHETPAQ